MYVLFGLAVVVLTVSPLLIGGRRQNNGTCSICNCLVKDVVDCSNKSLTNIPRDINVTTRVLNLSSNFLQVINDDSFENLTMLISLDLYNTGLKSENVSANAFKGLKNLKFLNISQNDQFPLTNVSTPPRLFEHMSSLEVLRMYGTTGTYNIKNGYPDEQLSKLSSLKELWIDGLTNMPFGPAFRNMTNLKVVRLAGNYIEPSWRSKEFCMIENLDEGILDNLVTVTHLYIRKCYITSIGKNAFQSLEDLMYLDLSKNKKLSLENLFRSFCSLSNRTTSLVLNNVVARSSQTYGTIITDKMIECLKDKPIRELHLNHNIIHFIEPNALSSLPKTIQIVSATKNEFYLGLYMFSVFDMTNLTDLDISYQFFTDETSIWHGKKVMLDAPNENLCGNKPEPDLNGDNSATNDIHKTNLIYKNRVEKDENDNSHGSNFQDFVQELFLGIIHKDNFQNKYQSTELQRSGTVCPQFHKDKYIPPGTVVANIPPNLKHLDMSHSKHASPILEMFINKSNTLETINASNSLLYCWDGPVHGLTKLVALDLSNNFCTNVSSRFFQTLTSLKRLNISFNFLGTVFAKDVEGRIMSNLTSLEVLDVSFNLIETIPELFLKSQRRLTHLYAKVNALEKFNIDISHMTKLRGLDLKVNRISTFSEKTCNDLENISQQKNTNGNSTARKTVFVNLRYNPIECSCHNIRFIKWLYKYFASNSSLAVNISHCILYENYTHMNFDSRHSLGLMVEHLEYQCRSYTAIIVGLSVALALIVNVILGVVVHRFRWKLQYWYYVVFDRRTDRRGDYELVDEPRYKYDVFVASSDDQKEFVVDKLRPAFKKGGLTAFIAVYHINFNERLVNVIGKAIHASRMVLFIFSDDWSSDHCMDIAVHMWQCDMIQHRRNSVLGIHLNDMKGMDAEKVGDIFCKNFIEYPGGADDEEEKTFWRECVEKNKTSRRQPMKIFQR